MCHRLCSRSGAAARMNPDYSFGRRRSRRYCPYLVIPAKRRPRSGRLEGRTTRIQPSRFPHGHESGNPMGRKRLPGLSLDARFRGGDGNGLKTSPGGYGDSLRDFPSARDGLGLAEKAAIPGAARTGREAFICQQQGDVAATGADRRLGRRAGEVMPLGVMNHRWLPCLLGNLALLSSFPRNRESSAARASPGPPLSRG